MALWNSQVFVEITGGLNVILDDITALTFIGVLGKYQILDLLSFTFCPDSAQYTCRVSNITAACFGVASLNRSRSSTKNK